MRSLSLQNIRGLGVGSSGDNPFPFHAPLLSSLDLIVGKGSATFTSTSPRYIADSGGVIQTIPAGTAAFVDSKYLSEPAGTNIFLNSAVGVTQTCTVTAAAWTLSFRGTGNIVRSGVSSGTLTGTGATNRVQQTFTPTAGGQVLTVNGSCTEVQLELGTTATSIIPTTGTSATRAAVALSYQTTSNFPTRGIRHVVINWTPLKVTVGLQQMLWSTRVDASNYTALWANGLIVVFEKRVAAVSEYVTFDLTPVVGTTYLIEGYIYADNTMGLKVNGTLQSGTLGSELFTNPGFTGGSTGWVLTGSWLYGTDNLAITAGTANSLVVQNKSTPYKIYQVGVDAVVSTGVLYLVAGNTNASLAITATVTGVTRTVIAGTASTRDGIYNIVGTTAVIDNLTMKQLFNNSTTLAPKIGTTMHIGGLSDGASLATLVAHAGFDNVKIYQEKG